jgi:arylsulfatase A-like enzyme
MSMAFDWSRFYYGWHWMERNNVLRHVTDLNREDALQFLKDRPKNQTFGLKVSFFATHAVDGEYPSYQPMNASKHKLYQNITIPTPKTATDQHWRRLPPFFKPNNEGRARWVKRFEPDYYQDNIKDLYRMATEVDAVVGDVITELKKQGVYNNTLLMFTTDNGNLHGEHGLAEKWYPFEESIRVPLVIQDPRMPQEVRGSRSDAWTLNIDLAPTMLGAAKVKPSQFMQGRDIAHLYLDENPTWRKDFFYEYNQGDPVTAEGHEGKFWIDASFALVTNEWKYVYWPQHDYEQLFHRSMDPYDEWDMLENKSMIQTTDDIYLKMKTRYEFLKDWVISGKRV